jgi:hypothetical protein
VSEYGVQTAGGAEAEPGYVKYNTLLMAAVAEALSKITTNLKVSVAPGAKLEILYPNAIASS